MTTRLGEPSTTKKLGTQTISMTKGMRTGISKRSFGQSTQQKPEKKLEDYAYEIYKGKLPRKLIEKTTQAENQDKDATRKKMEDKKDNTDLKPSNQGQTNISIMDNDRKEDLSAISQSEALDQSDDDRKKKEIAKGKRDFTEQELDQKIFITLSETPTTFMYFAPSQRYFTNKIDPKIEQEEREEKKKEENYKAYLHKRKNPESFAKRGAQTINKFKRNQLVSTASSKDVETDMQISEKVSALSWNIADALNEEKNKKDDEGKIFQKKLEKKIKKELKKKLVNSEFMVNIDESIMQRSQNMSESYSVMDTKLSSSIQSNRRPKPRLNINTNSNMKESQDKSFTNIEKSKNLGVTNPTSSMIEGDSSTVTATGNQQNKILIPQTKVRRALDEPVPNTMVNPLKFVERLLSQNKYHFRQIAYKNYPISVDELYSKREDMNKITSFNSLSMVKDPLNDEQANMAEEAMKKEVELVSIKDDKPDMKFLFRFSGKRIIENSRYIVHSLDWNPFNKDLLAAGYGDPDIDSKKEGLLCFWTLKNPLHPERVIKTPRGITSCNFSNKNPYYIVASDYAGEIMIYDLRVNSNKPIADSTEIKDKHTDIVWECKWIERPNDKNEMIVSISSDGKVKEWSMKKGLEVSDLMKMKKNISFPDKTLSPFYKYDKSVKESLVFRDANGLSFDFPKNDTTIYYISLEECTLHRCRISYKDQYTDTYYGHLGPAYKVRCNPYDPNVLISCSYDWTVKIWNSKQMYPLLNCHSIGLTHQVNDIEWSPFTSTIFGCVADDGRIEIWDLAQQSIDPIIKYKSTDEKAGVSRKSIKFSRSSQVVACGDSDFDIDIFRLYNLEHVQVSEDDQRKRLQSVLSQNSEISSK